MRAATEPESSHGAVGAVREHVAELDSLPMPGQGETRARWLALARIARQDLSEARLAEGHIDARAILTELGRPDLLRRGQVLGVWAAEPGRLVATPTAGGWVLDGAKGWCSGSTELDAALATATAPDGPRLFLLSVRDLQPCPDSWQPMGMAATRSDTITFRHVEVPGVAAVGDVDAYVRRPGFGHGGAGVAACWWGGALGVLDGVHAVAAAGGADPAAVGRGQAMLAAAGHTLGVAAHAIDARPADEGLAVRTAAQVRLAVASAARATLDHAIVALGASGLCHAPQHSQRVADLLVYLGLHREASTATTHGERLLDRPLSIEWR
jgi:alkylation response protein AidB-like acyl-CoA dehydrogenase